MKKLLLSFLAMAMCIIAKADVISTLTFPTEDQESVSAYNVEWKASNASGAWTFFAFNNNKNGWEYIRCGWKTAATVSTITTPAFAEAVSNITLTIDKTASVTKVEVYSAAEGDTVLLKDITSIWEAGKVSADIAGTAGKAYVVKIHNEKTSSNGTTQISKIEVSAGEVGVQKEVAGLQWSATSVSVEKGTEFTAPTLTKATDATITYTSDNEEVATINAEGVIALAGGLGTATITAEAAENEKYEAGKATCKITVFEWNTYKQTTEIKDGGQYLIVVSRNDSLLYAIPNTSKNYGYLSTSKVANGDIKIKSSYDDTFTLVADEDDVYSIRMSDGRYLYATAKNDVWYNSFNFSATPDANMLWTVEAQADKTVKITNTTNGYVVGMPSDYTSVGMYEADKEGLSLPMLYAIYTESDAIENVAANSFKNDFIYNLAGQRVGSDYKGVVIRSGKKMIQK